MNLHQRMQSSSRSPWSLPLRKQSPESLVSRAELHLPALNTHLLVEEFQEGLLIRATLNNISEERRVYFIRELQAEGFISDRYRWFGDSSIYKGPPVEWLMDSSWLKPGNGPIQTRRFMIRLLVCGGFLWLLLMSGLLLLS